MKDSTRRIILCLFALLIPIAILLCGCARFHTKQTDVTSGTNTTTTTEVSATTFWSAKSDLAKFRAFQSAKSQSATVGELSMSATNNAVEMLNALANILNAMPKP